MSHSLVISLAQDDFTPQMKAMMAEAQRPRAILAAAGRACTNFLKKHFRTLDANRANALGGRRQHFWRAVGLSVQLPELTDTNATVTVSDPRYAHKVQGGTIEAKRASFLTIPITPEAYGRTAAVFERETGMKLFALGHGGQGVLAVKSADGQVIPQYVLKKSVNQKPDPDAMPDMKAMAADVLGHARNAAERQMLNNGGPTT